MAPAQEPEAALLIPPAGIGGAMPDGLLHPKFGFTVTDVRSDSRAVHAGRRPRFHRTGPRADLFLLQRPHIANLETGQSHSRFGNIRCGLVRGDVAGRQICGAMPLHTDGADNTHPMAAMSQ